MTKILDMVPDLVDKFTSKKETAVKKEDLKDEEILDIAFPEDE